LTNLHLLEHHAVQLQALDCLHEALVGNDAAPPITEAEDVDVLGERRGVEQDSLRKMVLVAAAGGASGLVT